jgi:hypothetical protein
VSYAWAAIFDRLYSLDLSALKSCLTARHNLDHFDERIDYALANSGASCVANSVTAYMQTLARFRQLTRGKPFLGALAYIFEDHAVVTYTRDGVETVTD